MTVATLNSQGWVGCGGIMLLAFLASPGCSQAKNQVSGRVTFQGRPVGNGSVLMVGGDGLPRYGRIHPDGSYTVKRLRPGFHKIAVSSPAPNRMMNASQDGPGKFFAAGNQSAPAPVNWFPFPDRYADPETSDLTFEVSGGDNGYDIELN